MRYQQSVSMFPCEHDFDPISKSVKRCTTCRMPIEEEAIYFDLLDTKAAFCCIECKHAYVNAVEDFGII